MTTTDAFHRQMRDVAAQFYSWARAFEEDGEFLAEDTAGYWRLAACPKLANACAFEFVVHPGGKIDYFIGGESYEERQLARTDSLLPLIEAIAGACVIMRRTRSANSNLLLSSETIVTMADGRIWRDGHDNPVARSLPAAFAAARPIIHDDHYFAPYRHYTGARND